VAKERGQEESSSFRTVEELPAKQALKRKSASAREDVTTSPSAYGATGVHSAIAPLPAAVAESNALAF